MTNPGLNIINQPKYNVMIKKQSFLILLLLLSSITVLTAQEIETLPDNDDESSETITRQAKPIDVRDFYVGFGTGINYVGLLAITSEFNLYKNLSLLGTAGIGSWGYKILANVRYYNTFPKGLFYGAGINYSTGFPEVNIELETTSGNEEEITVELEPVVNIDLGIGYAIRLWKRGRLNIQIGYSIDVTSGDAYKIKPGQPEISDDSEKVMQFMKPGGFHFGLNMNFGL